VLKEEERKENVIGKRVEFEVKSMPDGKFRARAVALIQERGPGGARMSSGKILRYDAAKGYGFILSPDATTNVFFLRTSLPKELADTPPEELKDIPVRFELYANEDGKPRAQKLEVASEASASDRRPEPRVQNGEVLTGEIVRYDMSKAYGFVKPDTLDEDLFFLRVEMPQTLQGATEKEEIERQRVEFEVCIMPDGKMRAQRMLLQGQEHEREALSAGRDERGADVPLPPLEDSLIVEMEEFLDKNGGHCDYGKFSNVFPKVKKKQLEAHFEITTGERGTPTRIELPEGHPLKSTFPKDPADDQDVAGAMDDGADEAPDDEPAIPLQVQCQPQGVIRQYDPVKGYGFIRCDGLDEDIYFHRSSLPASFHGKKRREMPNLAGVHVAIDLNPNSDRGPRAERISLLMNWHAGDRCWLLKRA